MPTIGWDIDHCWGDSRTPAYASLTEQNYLVETESSAVFLGKANT